jgi:hypothetical protein
MPPFLDHGVPDLDGGKVVESSDEPSPSKIAWKESQLRRQGASVRGPAKRDRVKILVGRTLDTPFHLVFFVNCGYVAPHLPHRPSSLP